MTALNLKRRGPTVSQYMKKFYGKKHTKEFKNKIRIILKEKIRTPSTKPTR